VEVAGVDAAPNPRGCGQATLLPSPLPLELAVVDELLEFDSPLEDVLSFGFDAVVSVAPDFEADLEPDRLSVL
jgi:hypothetical protein